MNFSPGCYEEQRVSNKIQHDHRCGFPIYLFAIWCKLIKGAAITSYSQSLPILQGRRLSRQCDLGKGILEPSQNSTHHSLQMHQHSWELPIKSPELFINYEFYLVTIAKQQLFSKRYLKTLWLLHNRDEGMWVCGCWAQDYTWAISVQVAGCWRVWLVQQSVVRPLQSHFTPLDVRFLSVKLESYLNCLP